MNTNANNNNTQAEYTISVRQRSSVMTCHSQPDLMAVDLQSNVMVKWLALLLQIQRRQVWNSAEEQEILAYFFFLSPSRQVLGYLKTGQELLSSTSF
jgi:prenyltransferase beta subunit